MDDDGEDWDAAEPVVLPELVPSRPAVIGQHIKKRVLRNKALSVGFNDKDLRDFVTGFHKRRKKRRKEAQKQLAEKDRLKRIEARKRRKLEKEFASTGAISARNDLANSGSAPRDDGNDLEDDEPMQTKSVSGITTYETGDTNIIVTTSELTREEVVSTPVIPYRHAEKKQSLSHKSRPLKKVGNKNLSKKKAKHGPRNSRKGRSK